MATRARQGMASTRMTRVKGSTEHEAAVNRLWQEHLDAAFPAGLRGAEPAGIDVVLLDATAAGCVSTWLSSGAALDGERHRILRDCVADLYLFPQLLNDAEEVGYIRRLRQLARLVSDSGPRRTD